MKWGCREIDSFAHYLSAFEKVYQESSHLAEFFYVKSAIVAASLSVIFGRGQLGGGGDGEFVFLFDRESVGVGVLHFPHHGVKLVVSVLDRVAVHERSFRRLRADGGSLLCVLNGVDKD